MNAVLHFSAPGRAEICGNHTDHQHGCVLAAAVDLETCAEVTPRDDGIVRVRSEGYAPIEIQLRNLDAREDERGTSAALVRGVASGIAARGYALRGFEADVCSSVLPGSGLSSSAAYEVLVGRIFNALSCQGLISAVEIAQISQYAENVYFGKPSGLMDQMASSVGGLVYIDFADAENPVVEKVDFDFANCGYTLCTIDTGADHAGLTAEYAAIPQELGRVCAVFGKQYLRDVDEDEFYARLPELRRAAGDRAVLRAMHIFDENRRVHTIVSALRRDDFDTFLRCINESGVSSWLYLQNITPAGAAVHQEMALTLALAKKLLGGRGAVRVHGGGFAGTALAFVPDDMYLGFVRGMENVLGQGCCHALHIV